MRFELEDLMSMSIKEKMNYFEKIMFEIEQGNVDEEDFEEAVYDYIYNRLDNPYLVKKMLDIF